MTSQCFVFAFIATIEAQTFHQFGSVEYYWPIEQEVYVRSYDEAEARCTSLNATLGLIKTRKIGEFLAEHIGILPRK